MEILQPGIFNAIAGEVPVPTVLFEAAADVFFIVAALAFVATMSSLIEHAFKAIAKCFVSSSSVYLLEGYITYPGVVYHELSHALFAKLTGAKVTDIHLKPEPAPDGGIILGSVSFVPSSIPSLQAIQRVASGIAPSVTGLIGMSVMLLFVFPLCSEWWQWTICIYIFVCILLHSEMSPQDIRGALVGIPGVALVLFLIFVMFPFDPFALLQAMVGLGGDVANVANSVGVGDSGNVIDGNGIIDSGVDAGGTGGANAMDSGDAGDPGSDQRAKGVIVDPSMYA